MADVVDNMRCAMSQISLMAELFQCPEPADVGKTGNLADS